MRGKKMPEQASISAAEDAPEGEAGLVDLHFDQSMSRHPGLLRLGPEDKAEINELPDGRIIEIKKLPHEFMRLHGLDVDSNEVTVVKMGDTELCFCLLLASGSLGEGYPLEEFSRYAGWGHIVFHITERTYPEGVSV